MATAQASKVCIIGLDGATLPVLNRWMDGGEMPHLRSLRQRGAWGELMSTMPPVTGPAWTSMVTGVNPGQHGVYDFVKWTRGGRSSRLARSSDCTVPRIWDIAGDAGRRVGVYRVPVTYPAWPVNGFMVTGLLTSRYDETASHPPALFAELDQRGLARIRGGDKRDAWDLYLGEKAAMVDNACETMGYLLKRFEPDLFMCVVSELDHVQHQFWPQCSGAAGAQDATSDQALRRFFRALDGLVGMLRKHFGQDTTYLVVSDHGFGPVRGGFRVNRFLAEQGFLKLRQGRLRGARLLLRGIASIKTALGALRLLGIARAALRRIAPHSPLRMGVRERTQRMLERCLDWEGTSAFAISSSDCGIHVNRADRWANGSVRTEEETERVLALLLEALQGLRDPLTGEPALTVAVRPQQVHAGPYLHEAPDLLFALSNGELATVPELSGPLFGDYEKCGNHRMEGVLMAAGPGIRAGARADADILDVAPTALHALGLPVPGYMEGRVLQALYETEWVECHPARRSAAALAGARVQRDELLPDEDEERLVRDRLADLGYL